MKVGDRVKVVRIDTTWRHYIPSLDWYLNKEGYIGYTGYVGDIDDNVEVLIQDRDAYLKKDWLELIDQPSTALTLEPGKEYLAEPNWRMRCISDLRMEEDGEYPIVMEWYSKDIGWKGPYYYKKDGTYKYGGHNIIGPWNPNPKPVVDWSLYSKWTKAVAMDKNGIWHWFNARPVLTRADTWNAFKGYLSGIIPPEYAPKNADGSKWEGDWEDSLVVREDGK